MRGVQGQNGGGRDSSNPVTRARIPAIDGLRGVAIAVALSSAFSVAATLAVLRFAPVRRFVLDSEAVGAHNAPWGGRFRERVVANDSPESGGYKWGVLSVQALSADQYSHIGLLDPSGRARGAFGYGNPRTDQPFRGSTYVEGCTFPFIGEEPPPPIRIVQTGFINGRRQSVVRQEFTPDGRIIFYALDGRPLLVIDGAKGTVSAAIPR